MTNKAKVLELLQTISPDSLTNSEISSRTGITPHQQVFQITDGLVQEGLIQGVRNGYEWSFHAATSEDVPIHVQNVEELYESYRNFAALEQGSADERKFFNGRIKNAKRFVALADAGGHYGFVPGAYVAYRDRRTLEEWEVIRSGGYGERGLLHLDRVLPHSRVDAGHPAYQELCDAYAQSCAVRGITPSTHEDPLSFWLVRPDTEFLNEPASSHSFAATDRRVSKKVFIANFGRGNYEWPICKSHNTVATMIHEDARPFYDAGDRESFVDWCIAHRKAASGLTPTRPVASRWYGAMETVEHTAGDLWIHRADDGLWWTISKPDAPAWELKPSQDPMQNGNMTWVCHKPCESWSNLNRKGNRLDWNALHAKAKHFLFTEGTLQRLSPDNADYALALINGDDLSEWESRPEWKAKSQKAKQAPVTIFSAWQRTVVRMMKTAADTTDNSNGQVVERTVKNKELHFTEQEFEAYLNELRVAQEGLCALTGIPMQLDGEADDPQLLCSLDRIDSSGHYAPGNLQLVCRFINFWKNNSDNNEFKRLIEIVRTQGL